MNKETLLNFIAQAHKNTYAAPKEIKKQYRCKTSFLPDHKDYDFVKGKWRYHDSYAGKLWAPGREIVFFQDKPIWCMSYQGQTKENISEKIIEETFQFLKKALRNFDKAKPFRGPKEYSEGDFKYMFQIKGNYKYFVGQERILFKGKSVFFQDVMGSIIN